MKTHISSYRMNFDGTLAMKSITQFFSEEEQAEITGTCDQVLSELPVDLGRHAAEIEDLILYLGIKEFRYPTVSEIIPKFIDDLSLPCKLFSF